jgi:glyoxylase-like metal-dependent hydrolase (beta-lactamase superfamily II)
MGAIRTPGTINENTTLIDIGMFNSFGITAVYLVRGEKKCLIDGGTFANAPRLIKKLRELDAFPPDLIIVTHPHWDHMQGIPELRRGAYRQNKTIEVIASHQAVPLLADVSFNACFGVRPYVSLQDVKRAKEGDTIDLGGITLRIYEIPGHCTGHIAILDEKNKNIFVGDALGDKVSDDIFLAPFMPPCWEPDVFLTSVNKLKQIDYASLCLAHFGCVKGSEAKSILAEAVETCNIWWQFYERHAERLGDTDYMLQAMRKEMNLGIPELLPTSLGMRALLGLVMGAGTLLGKKTAILDKLAFSDYIKWLAKGYTTFKSENNALPSLGKTDVLNER